MGKHSQAEGNAGAAHPIWAYVSFGVVVGGIAIALILDMLLAAQP